VGGKLASDGARDVGVHVEAIARPGLGAAAERAFLRIRTSAVGLRNARAGCRGDDFGLDLFCSAWPRERHDRRHGRRGGRGRIFAGSAAKDLQLVDEWGGTEQAIATPRKPPTRRHAPVPARRESGAIFDWFATMRIQRPMTPLATSLLASERFASAPGQAATPGTDMLTFLSRLAPLANGGENLTVSRSCCC